MDHPCAADAMLQSALSGAWRKEPARPPRDHLDAALPFLLTTGAHGLGWRQVRHADRGRFRSLRDAYWLTVIDQTEQERRLVQLFDLLRRGGVEPLLVKGWAMSRSYPEPGVRPCGDIDLCVRPDQLEATKSLLAGAPHAETVDLHAGVADLDDRSWEQLRRRSRIVPLGETSIRILGAEDQLRHLCLHLMRHGAFRPLWLCDVAVAVETRPPEFDWSYCLAGKRRLTEWVLCALELARVLLDARLGEVAARAAAPAWMAECVRREWAAGAVGDSHTRDATPLLQHGWRPARLVHALRCRWPNPIEAVFKMQASPWTRWPLVWHQVQYAARRTLALLARSRRRAGGPLRFDIHQPD